MRNIIGEFTRECVAIAVARRLTSNSVLERLSDLCVRRGIPRHIRGDNEPEITARAVQDWLSRVAVTSLSIDPRSVRENGYVESFQGKLSDELLDGEIFDGLLEAKVRIEAYRIQYITVRPYGSLGYWTPVPEAIVAVT